MPETISIEIPSPISFRQVNEACIVLGVDTDKVLDNPVETLKDTRVNLADVIPLIEAIAPGMDMTEVAALTQEDLQIVGDNVAYAFFLSAYRQHCERRIEDTISLLVEQGVLPPEEKASPSNGSLRAARLTNTKHSSTLRFTRS